MTVGGQHCIQCVHEEIERELVDVEQRLVLNHRRVAIGKQVRVDYLEHGAHMTVLDKRLGNLLFHVGNYFVIERRHNPLEAVLSRAVWSEQCCYFVHKGS